MRILMVHNFYGSAAPSGENEVVHAETELMRANGHEVQLFTRHSDDIRNRGRMGALSGALAVPWNPFEAYRISAVLDTWKPDVLHAHNTFPLISPSIFRAARGACARVLTLHNYRLLCAAAIPMRDDRPCIDCIERRSAAPAVLHGCYRSSRVATLPIAAGIALHRARKTWHTDVEAFIALTDFQRDLMSRGGLPSERIEVKPNFYPSRPKPLDWDTRLPRCVFVGRLSAEKGVLKLVRAWRKWGEHAPLLTIIGDGPLRLQLEGEADGARVRFLGQLPADETQLHIAQARLLITPSECFEGFPMVLREAFAFGTAVAVSNLGPLPSLVDNGKGGLLLSPFNGDAMLQTLQQAWAEPSRIRAFGEIGHRNFLKHYTAEANIETLLQIYDRALHRRRSI